MKITYIGHSGFLAETADCYYIFDYFNGALPSLRPEKPVLVFSSHAHHDHYNPAVFDALHAMGMRCVTAVMSDDIPADQYPQNSENLTIIPVACRQTYDLPCRATLHTLRSTDEGVAFLLQTPEGILYHAGDLNDWVWAEETEEYNHQMTENYRREIDLLDEYRQDYLDGRPIDAAFLPLDPRQDEDYACGMRHFLETVPVLAAYPMHFWDQPDVIDRFLSDYPQYAHLVQKCSAL